MHRINDAHDMFIQPQPFDRTPELSLACATSLNELKHALQTHGDPVSSDAADYNTIPPDIPALLDSIKAKVEKAQLRNEDTQVPMMEYVPYVSEPVSQAIFTPDTPLDQLDLSWLLNQEWIQ